MADRTLLGRARVLVQRSDTRPLPTRPKTAGSLSFRICSSKQDQKIPISGQLPKCRGAGSPGRSLGVLWRCRSTVRPAARSAVLPERRLVDDQQVAAARSPLGYPDRRKPSPPAFHRPLRVAAFNRSVGHFEDPPMFCCWLCFRLRCSPIGALLFGPELGAALRSVPVGKRIGRSQRSH
jgi:hypothetical protein